MKTLVSALAVASLAGSAFGFTEIGPRGSSALPATVDRVNNLGDISQFVTIEKVPYDTADHLIDRGAPQYSAMGSGAGFLAATATASSPVIGFNDYQMALDGGSAFGAPLINPLQGLDKMRWIGGWGANGGAGVGGAVDFFFLQNDSSTAVSFTIGGLGEGNFIYTFTLNLPGGVFVPTEGFFASVSNPASAGFMRQFYAGNSTTTAAPTVGAQDPANDFVFNYGGAVGAVPISERFELQIPAPGAGALMGLAGLVGLRRRR